MIAILWVDLVSYGCPHCRSFDGFVHVQVTDARVWVCRVCHRRCIATSLDVTRSPIGFMEGDTIEFPFVQDHPAQPKL